MVIFSQMALFGRNGFAVLYLIFLIYNLLVRTNLYLGKSSCIWVKWLYSLGKSGCICIWAKVVVFE